MRKPLIACTFFLLASLPTFSADNKPVPAETKPEAPKESPKEEALKLVRADMEVLVDAEGSIDAARKKKIKILPDEFIGPYTIKEVLPNGQLVAAGATLFKLDTDLLQRLIRGAQEGLEGATLKLESSREEFENLKAANKTKMDRMALDISNAQRDLVAFTTFGEEQMLKGRALALRSQESLLNNRQEELSQLEGMYKDTQLASGTKEIVLDRARREHLLAKESLDLSRKGEQYLKQYEHPAKKELIGLTLEQKKQDIELYKVTVRLAESAKSEELKSTERIVRDWGERMKRLESDARLMEIKAPFAGIFNCRGLEAGDKVVPNVVIAELLDISAFEIKFPLSLRETRLATIGKTVNVRVADLGEFQFNAKIVELAAAGEAIEKGPVRFQARASIAESEGLRPGVKARVEMRGTFLEKVISIPRNAIVNEDGKSFCRVQEEKGIEKREIFLGSSNGNRVEVVRGLTEGQTIMVKETKK